MMTHSVSRGLLLLLLAVAGCSGPPLQAWREFNTCACNLTDGGTHLVALRLGTICTNSEPKCWCEAPGCCAGWLKDVDCASAPAVECSVDLVTTSFNDCRE